MGLFDVAKQKAAELYVNATEKAATAAVNLKTQTDILQKKQELKELYQKLGEKEFLEHTGTAQDQNEIDRIIASIREVLKTIDQLDSKLHEEEKEYLIKDEDVVTFENHDDEPKEENAQESSE